MNRRTTLKQYAFVIRELSAREIKRKYARSYLGILWSVLNPLLLMIVMSAIFSTMFKGSIENFPVYYIVGMTVFQMFQLSTLTTMTSLVDNKQMLIKLKFPMEIFPLSRAVTALVNFGYSCIAMVAILIFFRIKPSVTMLFFPVVVLATFVFSLGVSYLLSIAYVFFGDIKHLYGIFLTLLMYCSAIFYPLERLPETMQKIISHNPIYIFVYNSRQTIMYQKIPDRANILEMILWTVCVYVLGKMVFRLNKNKVMQKV